MRVVNMHEAKTHLSRLVKAASEGEPFAIARAGRPLVKVVALDAPESEPAERTGFLSGVSLPDDFDRMGETEIAAMFAEAERIPRVEQAVRFMLDADTSGKQHHALV